MPPLDRTLRREERNDPSTRRPGDLVDDPAIARIRHRDVQLVALQVERQQEIVARILFGDRLQGLELDVADLQVDEAHAPRLGDVSQNEPERHATALDDRALEGDPQPRGHLPGPVELGVVHDLELPNEQRSKLVLGDAKRPHGYVPPATRTSPTFWTSSWSERCALMK